MGKENKTSDKPQNGNDFIADVMQWVAIEKQEPPFDTKILTWNNNEPDEPSQTDTLIAIEHNSKGKLYKWLENGYPTHWMHLPKPPCA
jgi:hypothetical protein